MCCENGEIFDQDINCTVEQISHLSWAKKREVCKNIFSFRQFTKENSALPTLNEVNEKPILQSWQILQSISESLGKNIGHYFA